MRNILTLFSLPLVILTLIACTNNPSTLPPGQYEHSSTSVDTQGTKRTTDSSTEVYYDEYGNKKVKSDKKTTTDPKGLFNKSTSEQYNVVK